MRLAMPPRPGVHPFQAARSRAHRRAGAVNLVVTKAGPSWVIQQLRWVHEFSEAVTADRPDQAPVLTYDLLGIADGPGVTPYERIADLERHPLSMELTRNQVRARSALV